MLGVDANLINDLLILWTDVVLLISKLAFNLLKFLVFFDKILQFLTLLEKSFSQ
jgi:hypothetical protein